MSRESFVTKQQQLEYMLMGTMNENNDERGDESGDEKGATKEIDEKMNDLWKNKVNNDTDSRKKLMMAISTQDVKLKPTAVRCPKQDPRSMLFAQIREQRVELKPVAPMLKKENIDPLIAQLNKWRTLVGGHEDDENSDWEDVWDPTA